MAAETPAKPDRKPQRFLTDAERLAIIAACATGAVKGELAQRFNVVPETISRLVRKVKSCGNEANPFAPKNYREMLKNKSIAAIVHGLDSDKDAYKRANIGVKVLEGIGEFTQSTQQDSNVQIVVSWAGQAPESSVRQVIDVTGVKQIGDPDAK